ncbi:MAG: GrpB family protein, partial [Chloroflexi bacterium]|nr:GrpB family protein [Chloroflexota bacterium]
ARHIAFREFLKRHPEYRDQLGQLKWALAEQFDNDKYPYMDGKAALVREIIALAQREQG